MTRANRKRYAKLKEQDMCCCICNFTMDASKLTRTALKMTWEHLTPTSRGGKVKGENRGVAHEICNYLKGSQTIDEFIKTNTYKSILDIFWDELPFAETEKLLLDLKISIKGRKRSYRKNRAKKKVIAVSAKLKNQAEKFISGNKIKKRRRKKMKY